MRILLFTAVIFSALFVSAMTKAGVPTRFYPIALQQDGKVTLSPSFAPDGKTIYFAQSECSPIWKCPQRLKKSMWKNGMWTSPELVALPTEDRVDWPSVTPDGKRLIFSWARFRSEYKNLDIAENFDLFTLDLTDPEAVPMPILGADINRPRSGAIKKRRYIHNESLATITLNGDLYFMTERLDGVGERDIYMAPASLDGGFQIAHPLPAPINSADRDDGVWVNPQGDLMLLTYPNRGGEGGADIFVSKNVDGIWSTPLNLGPSVNSRFQDFAARLTPDNKRIVFTSDRPFEGQTEGLLQVWIADMPDIDSFW